ncbi:anti-sigma factor domain-containing protein [Melissospora conviva]|uniref:anti-sigma factor n=1 Tax=Melissospora conviva TaxID=3388432 RepID=UPI003B7AA7D9
MPHPEHDRLVFLALGEAAADAAESTHLASCAHCRAEVHTLRHVAGLGAGTRGLHDLPDPPEHVWQGIVAQVGAAESAPAVPAPRPDPSPEERTPDERDSSGRTAVGRPSDGEGTTLPMRSRRRGRWSRRAVTATTAIAAAAAGIVGTLVVVDTTGSSPDPEPARVVLASAPLAAYGATPSEARGEARVFDNGRLHLHLTNLPEVPGYYEVWLINPRNMKMLSIGVLGDATDELLPLPPNVDLEEYSVVDLSAEAYDNDPAHSGNSLLRGTLTD